MDVSAFLAKWMVDIEDGQSPDGAFPDVAPTKPLNPYRLTPQPGAPGWGDAPVILAWQHYLRYGDRELLADCYTALDRWMDHIARANPDGIRTAAVYNNYGDWLSVGPASDRTVVATLYWIHVATLMHKIADALGRPQDAARYRQLVDRLRRAFDAAFVRDGRIAGDTQTAYLLALDFDALLPGRREAAARRLIEVIEAADGHLQTGFLGVRHLCPVLADIGAADLAFDLLLKETYPSWGFSIRQGATTIWERWDGWTPERGFQSANMNSFNHYAYGAVGEWIWSRIAGLDWSETAPGFRKVRLRPLFDRRIGWCRATYEAHVGTFVSDWRFEDGRVEWRLELPPGTSGEIDLAGRARVVEIDGHAVTGPIDSIGAGAHRLSLLVLGKSAAVTPV